MVYIQSALAEVTTGQEHASKKGGGGVKAQQVHWPGRPALNLHRNVIT